MRKSQYQMSGVAVAALGFLAATPSYASLPQDEGGADAASSQVAEPELSSEQQAEVDSWPVEQQTAYMGWPAETKGYYWSLTPSKQMLFWRLTDEQKIALTAMTGPERDAAWQQIEGSASSSG